MDVIHASRGPEKPSYSSAQVPVDIPVEADQVVPGVFVVTDIDLYCIFQLVDLDHTELRTVSVE